MKKIYFLKCLLILISMQIISCKKDEVADPVTEQETPATQAEPKLIFRFKFDSTQTRLDGFGNPSTIPANHSAQSPKFNKMSAHYIELAPDEFTQIGQGAVLYKNEETTTGGSTAINFEKSKVAGQNEIFFSIPLKDVAAGNYKYLRVSLAYQNYDINVSANGFDFTGTLASFIGYQTYLTSYKIKDSTVTVNTNKTQGYWAFESAWGVSQGQTPAGATTVPNPIASTSPIPSGSCLVTGAFASPLAITSNSTNDITITVSLSTNKSFEWKDQNMNGKYEPLTGDTVTDMGIRGLIPIVN